MVDPKAFETAKQNLELPRTSVFQGPVHKLNPHRAGQFLACKPWGTGRVARTRVRDVSPGSCPLTTAVIGAVDDGEAAGPHFGKGKN